MGLVVLSPDFRTSTVKAIRKGELPHADVLSDGAQAYLLSHLKEPSDYADMTISGDNSTLIIRFKNVMGYLRTSFAEPMELPHQFIPIGACVFAKVYDLHIKDLQDQIDKIDRHPCGCCDDNGAGDDDCPCPDDKDPDTSGLHRRLTLERDVVQYYPQMHIAPELDRDSYPWINDAQPPLWDEDIKAWRGWFLYIPNVTFPPKTASSNTFINGQSGLREYIVKEPLSTPKWGDMRIKPGPQILHRKLKDGDIIEDGTVDVFAIASGSCVKFRDEYHYFHSCGEGMRKVGHWIAPKLGVDPDFYGYALEAPEDQTAWRDPRVITSICEDGTETLLLTIAGEDGIEFYRLEGEDCWVKTSTWSPLRGSDPTPPPPPDWDPSKPWNPTVRQRINYAYGLLECPQLRTGQTAIDGLTVLFWCANRWHDEEAGGGVPQTYWSVGAWDNEGGIFTEINRGVCDYGDSLYGAVAFQTPCRTRNYLVSWLGTWLTAPNLGSPHYQGMGTFRGLRGTSKGGEPALEMWLQPTTNAVYAKSTRILQNSATDDTITFEENYTDIQFEQVPECSEIKVAIPNETLEEGEFFGITHGDGEPRAGADYEADFFGIIITKKTGGWDFCARRYGTQPMYNTINYDRHYFIPMPDGQDTYLELRIDEGVAEVYVNNRIDNKGGVTLSHVYEPPVGSASFMCRFNVTRDMDGNITHKNVYDGSITLNYNRPARKTYGGLRLDHALGLFLSSSTRIVTSVDTDETQHNHRIRQIFFNEDNGLMLREKFSDQYEETTPVPTLPKGTGFKGAGTAIIGIKEGGGQRQVRFVGCEIGTSPYPPSGGKAKDRVFVEATDGTKHYLITDDEMTDIIDMLRREIQAATGGGIKSVTDDTTNTGIMQMGVNNARSQVFAITTKGETIYATGKDGKDGKDGAPGQPGKDGADGASVVSVERLN